MPMNKLLMRLRLLVEMPFSGRQIAAQRDRRDSSLDIFLSSFPGAEREAECVWRAFRSVAVVDNFPPLPDDDLLKLYGVADEDLDDVVLGIFSELNYPVPLPSVTERYAPLRTIRDVVSFVRATRPNRECADERPNSASS